MEGNESKFRMSESMKNTVKLLADSTACDEVRNCGLTIVLNTAISSLCVS